jgi:hypothetical protein
MAARAQTTRTISCACGAVAYEAAGTPVITPVCYCRSCQEGGRRIEALDGAPPALGPDGGSTLTVFHRKRVRPLRGHDKVEGFKLDPKSPTNRLVATCCNSALMLTFDRGPVWVSVYTDRLTDPPEPDLRVQTRHAPDPTAIPDDLPRHEGWPIGFIATILRGWVAYKLGR